MKQLIEHLVSEITGSNDFTVFEEKNDDIINYTIYADPSLLGMLIGKRGKTIKNIRNIVKVRATLEKKGINVSIAEKQ